MRTTSIQNPNCDGAHCTVERGEVRLLPMESAGNAILCYSCFLHELGFRRQENYRLNPSVRFALPAWDSLKVYPAA